MDVYRVVLLALYGACGLPVLGKLLHLLWVHCRPSPSSHTTATTATATTATTTASPPTSTATTQGQAGAILVLTFALLLLLCACREVRFSTCAFHDFQDTPPDCFLLDYGATGTFFVVFLVIFTMLFQGLITLQHHVEQARKYNRVVVWSMVLVFLALMLLSILCIVLVKVTAAQGQVLNILTATLCLVISVLGIVGIGVVTKKLSRYGKVGIPTRKHKRGKRTFRRVVVTAWASTIGFFFRATHFVLVLSGLAQFQGETAWTLFLYYVLAEILPMSVIIGMFLVPRQRQSSALARDGSHGNETPLMLDSDYSEGEVPYLRKDSYAIGPASPLQHPSDLTDHNGYFSSGGHTGTGTGGSSSPDTPTE